MSVDGLVLGLERLRQHLANVEAILNKTAHPSAKLKLELDEGSNPVVAGLGDSEGCERAARTRGAAVPVAPWIDMRHGLLSWLGYREEWSIKDGGLKPTFAFRASSITVHFGFRGSEPKPQMFRAEWAGPTFENSKWVMQAGEAGHPHWQFDAMDSLVAPATLERARDFADILREERSTGSAKEFAPPAVGGSDVIDLVTGRSLAAMHFASAAAWWLTDATSKHAHTPKNEVQLRTWLQKTLTYVAQELERV